MKNELIKLFDEKYNEFTKSFKKIADFIRFNQSTISYITINDLAKETGTSPATITRFSKNIGFSGYPALQEVFQKNIEIEASQMKGIKNAITDFTDGKNGTIKSLIDTNIELLSSLDYIKLERQIDSAIELLEKSRKIFVLGARGSYALAYYTYLMLKEFTEDVELMISGASDFTDKLLHTREDDILFTVTFYPYTNFTKEITKFFRDNNNKIITLTDKRDSEIGSLSDIVITTKNSGKAYTFVPANVIINGIIMKLANKHKDKIFNNLEKLNDINNRLKIYSDK